MESKIGKAGRIRKKEKDQETGGQRLGRNATGQGMRPGTIAIADGVPLSAPSL